jgi:hypothetical protein
LSLWTQRIEVRWQQNLRFYEHRYEVLRAFEDGGYLRSLREREERIFVRVGTAHQLVSFGPRGMSLALLRPDADETLVRTAASEVWERLQPRVTGGLRLGFQWLRELSEPYAEARKSAARSLLGEPFSDDAEDFALLFDGKKDDPAARYRLELGVLEASEVPARLARLSGRVAKADLNTPPTLWQVSSLPSVALFCDQEWDTADLDDSALPTVLGRIQAVRRAADNVVDNIASRVESEPR